MCTHLLKVGHLGVLLGRCAGLDGSGSLAGCWNNCERLRRCCSSPGRLTLEKDLRGGKWQCLNPLDIDHTDATVGLDLEEA